MTAVLMIARAELRRAWRSFVVLGLLAGITGGVALAALQVARRTSTAQARLEVAAGVPDAAVIDADGDGRAVAELPGVESAWIVHQGVAQVASDRRVLYAGVLAGETPPPPGLFHPPLAAGRVANPDAANEVVVSQNFRAYSGFGVGDSLDLTFLTREEVRQFDTGFGAPDGPRVIVTIVGVLRTGLESGTNTPEVFGTPALARVIAPESSAATAIFVRLDDGVAGAPAFERAVAALPASTPAHGEQEFAPYQVMVPSQQRPVIAVTARVLVTGLLGFAGIAALAGLLGTALALRRVVLARAVDPATTSAMGIVRSQARLARMFSMAPFVASAIVVALAVALALSGLNPIGSLDRREPNPGWHPNTAVLGAGALVLLGLLVLIVVFASRRRPRLRRPSRNGFVARATAGAPPVVEVGAKFALESGGGPTAVPVRSALAGTVIAVAGLVAVTVFASSLARTVDNPARWGWPADVQIIDLKPAELDRVRADDRIASISVVDEAQVVVGGRTTNAMAFTPVRGDRDVWTVLRGRMPERPGEVMLGARLSDNLDTGIGRIVTFEQDGEKLPFRVVGVGTGPNSNNNQFGTDVVVVPDDLARVQTTTPFSAAVITIAPSVDAASVLDDYGRTIELFEPTRPADIDNLAQLGALPELLVGFLAFVAIAVLAHLLTTAARRRRRELDVLAAIGFVPRQVRGVLFVAAATMVGVGLVLGLPLGLLAGRWGWMLTADSVYVPTDLASPLVVLATVALVALVVSFLVAAWPAWRVSRVRVADGLRDE